MPIIFTRPQGAGGGGGGQGPLGLPSDGTFADGLLDLTENTLVVDSVDAFNEILADLAPPPPGSINGTTLSGNRTLRTGKLPIGLSTRWYQDGKLAGDTSDRIIEFGTIILASADQSNKFGPGDEGFLRSYYNDGSGFARVANLDIVSNFDVLVQGPAVQDLSTWDHQGSGDPCVNATAVFSNGKGSQVVTSCGWYNSFNAWQIMNARMEVVDIDEGFTSFIMAQSLTAGERTTLEYKLWYDNDANTLSFLSTPTVVQNTLSSNKYLSGVRYYAMGDTFDIAYTGVNVFRKCYHISQVSRYRFEAQSADVTRNPATVPHYTDNYVVAETITADRSSYHDLNTRLVVFLNHPWKSSVSAISASQNRLYSGYGNVSTAKAEYFRDENYRLHNGSYNTIPTLTAQWNSQTILVNGQSLVYNEMVQYSNHNLVGTLPTGNPNYTGFSGNQLYLRGFYDTAPHSNVTLTLGGLDTVNGIGQLGAGDVNIEIKLPTQTGWLDGGKLFSAATFTGIDGDGCKVSASGNTLALTFGTFSTANSGYLIVIKITFRNTNRSISSISVNW